MDFGRFFESERMRWVRWVAVVLLISLGVGVFLMNFDDLRCYEAVCHDPVNVEAVVSVEIDLPYYDKYISYTYEGVRYERVFYQHTKSTDTLWEDGEVITVSIDPRNPGELAEDMLSADAIHLAAVLAAVGLTIGGYSLGLRNERFRAWRLRKAQKRKQKEIDYIRDVFLAAILVWLALWLVLAVAFPVTCGATASCAVLLMAVLLIFLPGFDRITSR